MRSESRSDGGDRVEMDSALSVTMTSEALESQLAMALDAAETPQTRFHLRQALQLVEALGE